MASMMKKAMIYLGLGPDEEYEQYEDYPAAPVHEAPSPVAAPDEGRGRPQGQAPRSAIHPRVDERPLVHPRPTPTGTVRPISPDESTSAAAGGGTVNGGAADGATVTGGVVTGGPARDASARPERNAQPERAAMSSAVRTLGPASAMPQAVAPSSFNDAQEIGDRFKAGQPVIVNLQGVDRDLRRRLVDFASGLCYAIAGKMERVADQVYLLTPADVEVPIEETRRHLD